MRKQNRLIDLASHGRPSATGSEYRVAEPQTAAALGRSASTTLRRLLGGARSMRYAPHGVLYHEGDACDTVYFITRGLLKLVVHLPNGRVRIVRLHRPGAILGLTGLFARETKHTAVAVSPVAAMCLPLGTVQRLRADKPKAYAELLERSHGYLDDADTWIAQFSTGQIRSRVARLLLHLAEFDPDSGSGRLHLLTCEEMGAALGVTTESTSRVLAEFKRRGILVALDDDSENKLYAVDIPHLRRIADR